MSAVSKGDDHFGSEILHRFSRFVCKCFGCRCNLLHGSCAAQVKSLSFKSAISASEREEKIAKSDCVEIYASNDKK